MEQLIREIPKAELHLHIEGTLEPELMFKLAKRNKISLKYASTEEIRLAYHFSNLQSFLDIYYEGAKVLITEEDFYDLTMAYLKRAKAENILHVEIFFDPQTHTARGIKFKTVINGIHRALKAGEKELGISSKLIMCFLRHLSEEDAFETLSQAMPYFDLITAVGLDSSEKGNPPEKFQHVFAKAREFNLLTVAHAGEEGTASNIWEAINLLKVSRIDHGVHCMDDAGLIKYLVQTQIPLTTCPLSNVKLCVYKKLEDHPLKKMLDAGICATINSDDPAYFGGYLADNLIACQRALDLTKHDIIQLSKNAFNASFISDEEKANYLQQLDEFVMS